MFKRPSTVNPSSSELNDGFFDQPNEEQRKSRKDSKILDEIDELSGNLMSSHSESLTEDFRDVVIEDQSTPKSLSSESDESEE